jgi:5'-3' exonuclease
MNAQNTIKKLLVDGDLICYRACCGPDSWNHSEVAINASLDTLAFIFEKMGIYDYDIYFSGSNNFRKQIYPEYKINRAKMERPPTLEPCKAYFIHYPDQVADTLEADDLLGLNQKEDTCIVSIDKDMLTIPGWHYNFVKDELVHIYPTAALYNFYYQLLIGDAADNVKGAKGIGPKKAAKILEDKYSEEEFYNACRPHFNSYEEMKLNADVLWIQRNGRLTWEEGIDPSQRESERADVAETSG